MYNAHLDHVEPGDPAEWLGYDPYGAVIDVDLMENQDRTGTELDFDWRGTPDDVRRRLASHPHFAPPAPASERSGPGRPRLGVVSREVSLLPRHWSWLAEQPGGASATLRRLVDEARKEDAGRTETRRVIV